MEENHQYGPMKAKLGFPYTGTTLYASHSIDHTAADLEVNELLTLQGVTMPAEIYNISSMFWVYLKVSYQLNVARRPPGCILTRCLNYLNWLLLTQRSSGSILSSLSEHITLSLRLSPAPHRGKLFQLSVFAISQF